MKGKKTSTKSSGTNGMHNNPFKALKGLSVSAPEKVAPGRPVAPVAAAVDEPTNFAEAMARLGVQPLAAPSAAMAAPAPAGESPAASLEPASDAELFVAALGQLDTVFTDSYPDGEGDTPAAPRRMKQLERGRLRPEETLDLHGLGRDEALERVRYFLDNAVYHGRKVVLIVTGRGLRSSAEPVLRAAVERYLDGEGRPRVAEWGRAPRQFGGDGALAVFLKSAERRKLPGT